MWGGHEKVWNLVMVFVLFLFKKLIWDGGKWGSTMLYFFLLLILGSREAWGIGGLDEFFFLSLIMGGATMGGHGHFFIKKIDHWLGGAKVEIH